jgi:hypothetical protein
MAKRIIARLTLAALTSALLPTMAGAGAQVSFTTTTLQDAFVCTGSPSNTELNGADLSGLNFGAAGTLVVAPAASPGGEFQTLLLFPTAGAATLFNSAYGSNHWILAGVSLQLTSNSGVAGSQPNNKMFPVIAAGQFLIQWLSDDVWSEGTGTPNMPSTDGVCFNSLPGLLGEPTASLGTYNYVPPGNNIPVIYPLPLIGVLGSNILAGGNLSLLLQAADNQIGYLFNSHEFAGKNVPLLEITAQPLLQILSINFTNQTIYLTGVGATNASYNVQSAPTLLATNWQTIGTVETDAQGAFQFSNSVPALQPATYYRLSD